VLNVGAVDGVMGYCGEGTRRFRKKKINYIKNKNN